MKVAVGSLVATVFAGALVWQVWFLDYDTGHEDRNAGAGMFGDCEIDPNEVIARARSLRELKAGILEWDVIAGSERVEVFRRDGARFTLIVRGQPSGPDTVQARRTERGTWVSAPGAGCG